MARFTRDQVIEVLMMRMVAEEQLRKIASGQYKERSRSEPVDLDRAFGIEFDWDELEKRMKGGK